MKKTFFAVLGFFAFTTSFSQTGWTLQQCIDQAIKNNLSIKQSEITSQMSEVNLRQSEAGILPSLNAGATHTYNIGKNIDRYTNTFANSTVLSQNFYLSSQVTLWSGMAQYNNVRQNDYSYRATKENLEQMKNDVSLNVASSYLQVIYNGELMKVAESQVKISKEQLDRTEKMAEAGSVAKSSVYDIKAQLANDEYTYISTQNSYNIALLNLKQLLYLDTVNNFSIARPDLEVLSGDLMSLKVSDVYQEALKNQHSIKSAEYTMMSAEKGLAAARGKISPTLNFNASIGTGYSGLSKKVISASYNGTLEQTEYVTSGGQFVYTPGVDVITQKTPFTEQFKNNVNKSVGFSLNVPLFNGLSTYSTVKNAKLQMLNSKYAYDLRRQQLFKTIAQAYADAQASLNKFVAAKAAYDAANTAFTFTEQKFNVGAISAYDYSNAKNRLLKSQADVLNGKFDYIFKLKVLDFYQGKPLTF
ncbi:MAG: TolC family protein [Bacteroidia bacterium]